MTKEVTIQVVGMGSQTDGDEEMTIESYGQYSLVDGEHIVSYEEMIEGLDTPLHTAIHIYPGTLILEREGEVTTRMEFMEGNTTKCEYASPYGSLLLDIYTRELHVQEQDGILAAEIIYDMRSGPEVMPDCHIRVRITSTH